MSKTGSSLATILIVTLICRSAVMGGSDSKASRTDELIAQLSKIEKQAAEATGSEKTSVAELKSLLPGLSQALNTLGSSESLALINGDSTLQDLGPLLAFRLAGAHARLGQRKEALELLNQIIFELPGWRAQELRTSPTFASIKEDPGFKQMLARLERWTRLWDGSSFATDFKENLTDDEKVAGLSVFWSEAKNSFMDVGRLVDLDWDRLFLSYLPRVRQTRSTFEYYRLLQQMCAQLKDGHTRVFLPQQLSDQEVGVGGLKFGLIEDKVIIFDVVYEELRAKGLERGQEILSIDGIPVRKYAEERVAPYQFASTPQDLAVRVYSANLLSGPKDQPIELELKTTAGAVIRKTIPRGWGQGWNIPPLVESRMLDGNIAYVAVNSLNDPKVVPEFDKAFESTIHRAGGLILDIRNNGGGNSGNGYEILGYLTDHGFPTSRWQTRSYVPTFRSWGNGLQWRRYPAGEGRPNGKKYFNKPVAVLVGPRTYSAAEDFCVAFRNLKRGSIIGEATGGSTGNPLFVRLPGGGGAIICSKLDSFPDGSQFVGVGIKPDIAVSTSVQDAGSGRDTALETAVRIISKKARSEGVE